MGTEIDGQRERPRPRPRRVEDRRVEDRAAEPRHDVDRHFGPSHTDERGEPARAKDRRLGRLFDVVDGPAVAQAFPGLPSSAVAPVTSEPRRRPRPGFATPADEPPAGRPRPGRA